MSDYEAEARTLLVEAHDPTPEQVAHGAGLATLALIQQLHTLSSDLVDTVEEIARIVADIPDPTPHATESLHTVGWWQTIVSPLTGRALRARCGQVLDDHGTPIGIQCPACTSGGTR